MNQPQCSFPLDLHPGPESSTILGVETNGADLVRHLKQLALGLWAQAGYPSFLGDTHPAISCLPGLPGLAWDLGWAVGATWDSCTCLFEPAQLLVSLWPWAHSLLSLGLVTSSVMEATAGSLDGRIKWDHGC